MNNAKIIHTFWHGSSLSRVEQLCLSSFIFHGHQVHLHVYEEVGNVPAGVNIIDASQTLSPDKIFHHKRTGSVALFADWFRYRLLYERGGIWVDTDVVCLKPFNFKEDVVFGLENSAFLNNAVIGLPAGHPLAKWMADCCESPNTILPYDTLSIRFRKWRRRYFEGNKRERIRWGEYGPKGLTHAARYFGVMSKALPIDAFYPISCEKWLSIFEGSDESFVSTKDSYGLHLWNNMMRTVSGFNKNGIFSDTSLFEILWKKVMVK